jgi:hypothetical protein
MQTERAGYKCTAIVRRCDIAAAYRLVTAATLSDCFLGDPQAS